jgi:hypothetical protein
MACQEFVVGSQSSTQTIAEVCNCNTLAEDYFWPEHNQKEDYHRTPASAQYGVLCYKVVTLNREIHFFVLSFVPSLFLSALIKNFLKSRT